MEEGVKSHRIKNTCTLCKNLDKTHYKDQNHYFEAKHQVSTFVDDCTSNIGLNKRELIEPYIKIYLNLLYNYYTINFLTLNRQKTKFTIIGSAQQIAETRTIKIKIDDKFIHCDGQVRILGLLISSDNSDIAALNELIKSVNFRLFNLAKVRSCTDFKTRLRFLSSFVMGKISYLLPIFLSASTEIKHKLHLLQIKTAKAAWGSNTFRVSNKKLLERCGWPSLNSYLQHSSLTYIHRILYTGIPDSILEMFIIPNRQAKNIIPLEKLKCKHTRNFFLYTSLIVYNRLKNDLKLLPPKRFKVELKKVLRYDGITP